MATKSRPHAGTVTSLKEKAVSLCQQFFLLFQHELTTLNQVILPSSTKAPVSRLPAVAQCLPGVLELLSQLSNPGRTKSIHVVWEDGPAISAALPVVRHDEDHAMFTSADIVECCV